MNNSNPFSQDAINEIFKVSIKDPDRIKSRESTTLEFKQTFGWNSLWKYLKTAAAFANTKGGYILFGIKDSPHILKGLRGNSLKNFDNFDPEKLSNHFNDYFSPEIKWNMCMYDFHGKNYGLLYIYESENKPVICLKNYQENLKESDIYYRYRGRSERIKYPELRGILDDNRIKEQLLWMRHLEKISKIGVRDVGLFDLNTGVVSGTSGSFLIDESLVSQLAFIKEGEFDEVKGKPALKVIGEIEQITSPLINTSKKIIKTKGIRFSDIILAFLSKEFVEKPIDYITQILHESSAFLPIYYYIRRSKLTANEVVKVLEESLVRSRTRPKLVERIELTKTQKLHLLQSSSEAFFKKTNFIKVIKEHAVPEDLEENELFYCLQGLRSMSKQDIVEHNEYICDFLRTWFNKTYSNANSKISNEMRRAICWIDEAMYMEGI